MSLAPDLSMFSKETIRRTLDEIRHPVSVAVWGSSNYFNAGAIIRTSHCFLVKNIFLIDCPAVYERASLGTEKYENIIKMTTEGFAGYVMDCNRHVVALEKRPDLKTEPLVLFNYPKDPILLFGCEKTGIPAELLKLAGNVVSIPQYGIQNDLNLAQAVSICLFDWISKNVKVI